MNITRDDLTWAADHQVITPSQADQLWRALEMHVGPEKLAEAKPAGSGQAFDIPTLAYYFGALIVISAMGWFATLAFENFGGGVLAWIALAYAAAFIMAGRNFWYKEKLKTVGGLLFTMAVSMTPLFVYGVERAFDLWPQSDPGVYHDFHEWVRGGWLLMEIGTLVTGGIALRYIRFPFLTAPVAFVLWYMSMDMTPLIYGPRFAWNQRLLVSMVVGLAMIVAAYLVDRRTKEDYAFWGYLFGLMAFWGGLSLLESGSEFNKFLYCLLNVGMMFISVLLERRSFLVFGSFGVFGYLGHLSWVVFKDSMLFPMALSLLGILIIYFGVKYHKNRAAIEFWVRGLAPPRLRSAMPANRT